MMESRLFFLLLLLLAACDTSNNINPRFENYFISYYGTEGDQIGADLLVNDDGTMWLLGNSHLPSGVTTSFLIKVDRYGKVLHQRQVGGENEVAVDIEKDGNENFIIASNVGNESSSRIRLIRITSNATGIDSVLIALHKPEGKQIARSVTCISGSAYVVTGYADGSLTQETTPLYDDQMDILALKISNGDFATVNPTGESIVNKGGESFGAGVKVFESDRVPGQLIMFSSTNRPNQTNDFRLNFSYDIVSAGVPVGALIGSNEMEERLSSVIKTPLEAGEGFLLGGTSAATVDGAGDLYLVKFNPTFEHKSLDKKINMGRNIMCVAVENAPSGYYVLSNEIIDVARKNILLTKISPDGNVDWTRNFGASDAEDTGAAITMLPDGRIAVVGTMQLKTRKKLALIVVNSNGEF